ncbi:MAG: hypothetical protein IT529_06150 [Burkholderiales bacterium]|nr:hypothetical protein [Burkholderiales bacterium]
MDFDRIRREEQRWNALLTFKNAAPDMIYEEPVLAVMRAKYPDTTERECRVVLDYLAERDLIDLVKEPSGRWKAKLNRHGVDVVEYTVDVEPGIARPAKYW